MKLFIALSLLFFPLIGSEEQARQKILDQLSGEWAVQGIYAVVNLDIPSYLDQGPLHYMELARLSATDPESLYRLLRMLASQGIFFEHPDQIFSHSEKSKLLSKHHPSSLYHLTRLYGGVIHQSWEGLLAALHSRKTGFEEHFGMPVFPYFKEHPQDLQLFLAAMEEKSRAVIDSCLKNFDFASYKTICDVGGGKGHFLWKILETHKEATGILLDLPEVIEEVKDPHHRCQLVSGNFFQKIPTGCDLYILKSVLHDWSDDQAKVILKRCYEAMHTNSKLLIVEPMIGESNIQDYAKLMDVLMLNITGGKERSDHDFAKLLNEAHFTVEEKYPTSTEFKIIMVKKEEKE